MKQSLSDPITPVIVFIVVAVTQLLCGLIPKLLPLSYYISCIAAFGITLGVWIFGLKKEGNFWDLVWAVLLALPLNALGSVVSGYITK